MNKFIFLLLCYFSFSISAFSQCPSCPEHIIVRDSINCNFVELSAQAPAQIYKNSDSTLIRACQFSTMKYCLQLFGQGTNGPCTYPNFQIDSILVLGGTLVSNTNSCFTVNWGGANSGSVQIQFSIPGGGAAGTQGCNGTITLFYKLLPNPIAAFTASPNPACFNNPTNITFNSSASVGALSYLWNFGDGFTSTAANPVHAYTNPGTYTVCLTVTNSSGNGGTVQVGACPSCSDSVCHTVVINNLPGPDITCIATVCAGETGYYCTSASCSTYNWVVTGGVITSGLNSPCVTVQWGNGNPQGNIHLDVPGCPGFCSQGTDITVPIIPSTTNITGSSIVCVGTTSAYSMPTLPGTVYNWTISGGQFINGNNTNTTSITTTWNNIGTYTVTCVYFDTSLNCGGTGTIVVNVLPEMKITGPVKRCAGQSSILHSANSITNANVNCNWTITPTGATITGGNGTSFVNITWTNPGTYLVTATPTISNQVCAPAVYTVIVYPQPILSAINGPDSICANGTAVYSATSNMAGLFNWVIIGGTATMLGSNNDSVQIAWNPSGPYNISVTQTSYANNCPSNALNKTVFPYPNPNVIGSTNVCADAIVTYTITNIGATNFNWHVTPAQFGTVTSTIGNSVSILWHGNNNPGGTNTVYLHYGNCKDDSIAITITEPIAPTITQTGQLCIGAGITLTSSGSGIFSWSHQESPPYSSGTNTLSNVNDPGHYTVQITMANGCIVTKTINIASVGMPVAQIYAAGPVIYCSPANAINTTLNAITGAGYSYQWYLGASPISGATNASYNLNPGNTPSGVASYTYHCVVMKNGCSATSNNLVVQIITCPTGGNGTGGGCSGVMAISNISGCNPFIISTTVSNGVYIISGSQTITHFEDGLILSGNTTRTYNTVGPKSIRVCVDIKMADSSVCHVCKDTFVLVTVSAKFLKNINCDTIKFTDLSTSYSPVTIPPSGYNWSVTPSGTFNFTNIPNPLLTVTSSGTYIVTQTVTGSNGCVSTFKDTMIITLPNADFNVNPISCVGTTIPLNNLFPALTNYWNFGDLTSSNTSPTFHAYASTGSYLIIHTVTDAFGCTNTKSKPITIIAAPICNITITGATTFCFGDSVKLSACAGYSSYQWKNNGINIAGATSQIYYAKQTGNYSFIGIDPNGCDVKSDTIAVTVLQIPSTSMTTSGKRCFGESYTITVPSCGSCLYQWEVDGNIIIPFGIANSYTETVGNAPYTLGTHLVKVTIIGSNGCISKDSITILLNPQPTISCTVLGNPAQLCSNNNYTFNATSNAASPSWAWTLTNYNAILSTTSSLIASAAGIYNVLVTDGITGCTNSTTHFINESPDLTLFPIGCDTLCQNTSIFLPLASFNGNISGYTITWYDNAPPYNNVVGTGISLNLNSLSLGTHNLSVIVVGPNGCVDTSNVYHIYVVPFTSSNLTASACGSYTWTVNGVTYTSSGTYTSSTINANGCPQNDTLHLTITNGVTSSVTITSCAPYLWPINGVTYSLSGTYTHTTLLANGCIKIDSLILNITPASGTYITLTACDSLTYKGVTYYQTICDTCFGGIQAFDGSNHYYEFATIFDWDVCLFGPGIYEGQPYTYPVDGHFKIKYNCNGQGVTVQSTGNYASIYPVGSIVNPTFGASSNPTLYYYNPDPSCGNPLGDKIFAELSNEVYPTGITDTFTNVNGCDSIVHICIIINHGTGSSNTVTACNFYTWPVNGITYTISGNYTATSVNANGCLQTDTLHLTINHDIDTITNATACGSYTWAANGQTYTASGTYSFTTALAGGCVQYNILVLTISNSGTSTTTTANACGPYFWVMNGVTYTASGTYTYTTSTAAGCISTHTLILTIHESCNNTQNVTICDMYTWPVNGLTYTASGIYTYTVQNANGCICTYTLNLTIQTTTIITSYVTVCGSYTWPVNGQTYTVNCVQTHVVYGGTLCPTIYVLCLTILPNTMSHDTISACNQYTWPANGVTYTASGVYTQTSLNTNGCLHTRILHLTILQSTTSSITASACNSYTWALNGVTYTASGTYTVTSLNAEGCLHTSTLILTITGGTNTTLNVIACDAYSWFGVTYTQSGIYTHTSLNTNGCLQTTTLNLTINTSTIITTYITACGSYTWTQNGITYTASGTYTKVTIGPNGCPRVYVLCLTICQNTSSSITVSACNSYTWSATGLTYTSSGTYTKTSLNACGCVHTATLVLTINSSTNTSSTITACNTYTWPFNGVTYTNSGIYTATSLGTQGCVNTSTLNLTINHGITSSISIVACDQYLWNANGVTYTASGVYTYTSLNPTNGCINSATLNLTIHHSTSSTVNITACDSYTWVLNGVTYTASGTYTFSSINTEGCPNTVTLHLTIHHGGGSSTTVFACEAYTWIVNGVTYTSSGIYTYSSMNTNGCPQIDTLILTLGTTTITHVFDTACCSYTWNVNGVTYTESGIYPVFGIGPDGCPHITILCVTIYPCVNTSNTVVACGSYTWNGNTYTTSGTYTRTALNSFGCPITDTLHLTIGNIVTSTSLCDTVCDSYTWPINGVTYTSSGVYTYITYDALGCPHIYILCITILHHTNGDVIVTAAGSYTWNATGITYTVSGNYTTTLVNSQLCDSILTLHLSITPPIPPGTIAIASKAMLSGPYQSSTGLMSDSLRVQGLIPLSEPYSGAPYFKLQLLGGGGETTTSAVLNVSGSNAIVDWVHIEIRSATSFNTIIATKNALLQRDGDIVSTDGITPISFPLLAAGNYYVSIKHRNHLGVMSSVPISLAYGLANVDFTNIPLFVNTAIVNNTPANSISGINVLWSGDPNNNKNVKYNGSINDKDPILNVVGISTPNNVIIGYRREDLNMDGKVMFNNTDNDRVIILSNVGTLTPNKVLYQHTPN